MIDINKTTRDSGTELEVVKNETEETETKRKSRNIIIHGVEELMDTDPKELENEDHKYVENVIMKPMGITSRPIRLHRFGAFTHERTLKERYRPLKDSLERVEVKSQFLQNLSRLKGQFIKITEDLTKQERILVKEWQDKANNKNEKEHNKRYKWRVRGSPPSRWFFDQNPLLFGEIFGDLYFFVQRNSDKRFLFFRRGYLYRKNVFLQKFIFTTFNNNVDHYGSIKTSLDTTLTNIFHR